MATILLIDDDPDILDCLGEMLARSGHTVLSRDDGSSALELLKARKPVDLIITDYSMPGMDGIELVRSLREMRSPAPIVYMTGIGGLENYLHAKDLGISGYLQKPVNARELLRIVRESIHKSAAA